MGRRGRIRKLHWELAEFESEDDVKPEVRRRGSMTEDQWLACLGSGAFAGTGALPPHLASWGGARKSRLIACGWCRLHWAVLLDQRSRQAVEAGEAYAEGIIGAAELLGAFLAAEAATRLQGIDGDWRTVAWANSCAHPIDPAAWVSAVAYSDHGEADRAAIAALIREIVGNPFHAVVLDPSCATPTVTSLARATYDQRLMPSGELDPTRLAVLADALEEAGCTEQAILEHLRSSGRHVRGCWPVDLVLAKE